MDYWFHGKSTVVAYVPDRATGMVGEFYLKPDWPGRASHVANASFIVAPDWRNKGLGRLLGETMLAYAKQLGFKALRTIPGVVRKDDGSHQDAIIMFRSLIEI
jgi:GNAT superfamily N-acetyltransferase